MGLELSGLQQKLNQYAKEREQLVQRYHQMNGAIFLLEQQITELTEAEKQSEKKRQQEAAKKESERLENEQAEQLVTKS